MSELILHQPNLVTVTWEEDIQAIVIKWDTLYLEDTGVRKEIGDTLRMRLAASMTEAYALLREET